MNRHIARHISIWLAFVVIVGCTPVAITPPPTLVPGEMEAIIGQTAAAAQTQTAILRPPTKTPTLTPFPTKTATVTPTPTATILFITPTETFEPDILDGASSGTTSDGTGSSDGYVKPTATPSEWECRLLSKSPVNHAVISAGTSFKAIWTVQNTGTKTWPKQGVDVVYESGARLNVGRPYYDIPTGVGPGGTVTISVTMTLPKRPKEYNMRWSLKVGRTNFCSVRFAFEAK